MEIEDSGPSAISSSSSRSGNTASSSSLGSGSKGQPGASKDLSAAELDAKRLVEKREEKRRQKGQELRQKETHEAEKREKLFSVEDRRKSVQQQQQQQQQQQSQDKKDGFLAKLKYRNTLPDIPFDPKLLQYPFDPLRFVRYAPTALDKKFKFDMRPEPSLGIRIDLIDIGKYSIAAGEDLSFPLLHPSIFCKEILLPSFFLSFFLFFLVQARES